jgi:membrane protease YdiL (CAAX protease family)
VAWVVIVACAAALMARPRWLERAGGSPTTQASLPSVADTRSPQVELVGRYVVGARALAGTQAPPADDLIKTVDEAASSPIDEFRAIIVGGELAGGQAALERLDAFERRHRVVRLRADVDALRRLYADGPASLAAEQQRLLVANHHWFGQLALSYGLPADDARRAAAMRPAGRSVIAMAAVAFLGFGAVFTGVVLLILGIVLAVKGSLRRAYAPPGVGLAGPLLEAFALYLLIMVVGSQLLGRLFPDAGIWVNFPLAVLVPGVMGYLRARGLRWGEVMTTLGWSRGRGFWREVGVGLVGYVAGLPVLVAGMVVTFLLMKYTGRTASHPIVNQPLERVRDVLGLVLLAVVWAPTIEETMFRGALFSHLRARVGWWVSAPIVSLIFAAIHPQGWVAIPVLAAIALVLAGLREWRGSGVAAMVAHGVNNAVAVTVMLLMLR